MLFIWERLWVLDFATNLVTDIKSAQRYYVDHVKQAMRMNL